MPPLYSLSYPMMTYPSWYRQMPYPQPVNFSYPQPQASFMQPPAPPAMYSLPPAPAYVPQPAVKAPEPAPVAKPVVAEKPPEPSVKNLLSVSADEAPVAKPAIEEIAKGTESGTREKWVSLFRKTLIQHPEIQEKLDQTLTPEVLDKLEKAKTPEDYFHVALDSPTGKEYLEKLRNRSRIIRWPFQRLLNQFIPKSFADMINSHLAKEKK